MKYFTLLCFSVFSLIAMAQNYSLTIFNNNGQQFFAVLNGIRQNSLPQTNLKISGMSAGSYELKLIFADGKTGDINKKFWFEESGDYLVRVDFKKGKGKLKYFGVTNQGQPSGGTGVDYRPNDQSVYSDLQTTGTVQNGNSQNASQGTASGNTATGQTGNVSGTATDPGTGQGSTTVTTVGDPSAPNSGTVMTTTTVTDPTTTGNGASSTQGGSATMTTSTTVTDPSTGGTGGMSTTITDPSMNGGNGGMTSTIKDPVTGETIVIDMNMNMSDPNLNGGTGTYGTTTTVTGIPNGTTTTSSSSSGSYHATTTTTITENGTTTTTTTTEDKTWGNGQPKTTGTVTGTQTTGTTTTGGNKGSYSCTEVLTDMKTVQTKLSSFNFDDDKSAYVQKDLGKYCMTTDQAVQILKSFTFDEDKMEMAKFLYPRLTDKMNATKIAGLFTFDEDKEEFQSFIQSH